MSTHRSSVDQMQSWQEDWLKASEDFPKPQIITDAESDTVKMRNLHDSAENNVSNSDMVVKSLDTHFVDNPTHFATVGMDQYPHVTPNFSDGPILRELNALKLSLHALEDKANKAYSEGSEKEEEKLRKELANIRSKIDELSNQLMPNPIADRS